MWPTLARRALPARTGAGTGELFAPPKPRTYVLPPLDAPLTDAFDEWELLGFPLFTFLLLTEDAKAVVRSGVLAATSERIGEVVTVVSHLVTVEETATAKGERMSSGALSTSRAPGSTPCASRRRARLPVPRPGVRRAWHRLRIVWVLNVDAQRMERLAPPDPRYAENGVMPAGIDSGLSSRRQPPKSASAPGFRGTVAPPSVP